MPPEALRSVANDKSRSQSARASAVFSLFASHLHPPADSALISGVLVSAPWLSECGLEGCYTILGRIPVIMDTNETAFCLRLFPNATGWSDWVIYFTLTGGCQVPVSVAQDLLAGKASGTTDLRMNEFALCFPKQVKTHLAREERFTKKGMQAFETR